MRNRANVRARPMADVLRFQGMRIARPGRLHRVLRYGLGLMAAALVCAAAGGCAERTSSRSIDPPFGIAPGASIASLGGRNVGSPGYYEVAAPPKPHPAFRRIVVFGFPEIGACGVEAEGQPLADDSNGDALRAQIDAVAAELSEAYGPAALKALCEGPSCGRATWKDSLRRGERYYGYEWRPRTGAVRLARLQAVGAWGLDISRMELSYEYRNYRDCLRAEQRELGR